MNTFEMFVASLPSVDVLAGFTKRTAKAAGATPAQVSGWHAVHQAYYGPTRFTRKQADALSLARAFPLEQLVYVEKRLKQLDDEASRWDLRLQLLRAPGTYRDLKALADEIVPEKEQAPPQETVRISRTRDGYGTFSATLSERMLADLEFYLRKGVDRQKAPGPQMHARFVDLIQGKGGVATAVPRPQLMIPLDAWIDIHDGRGDETVLGLTDGTTMTGAEYLNKYYAEPLGVVLFHPVKGPVNAYETDRGANPKQRDMAALVMPGCPWADCRISAEHCEVHHVVSWKHGGLTNMDNLATLCPYHNRVAGTGPGDRGGIDMPQHVPTWISPGGVPVRSEHHDRGAMHLLFGY